MTLGKNTGLVSELNSFSLIIPTCNRAESLLKCLEKIRHLNLQVIVSDDSSGNETQQQIHSEFPSVIYTRGSQAGPAANRNNGAKHATGQWLILIDDDCVPQASLLEAYQVAIQHNPGIRAFEGAIHPEEWDELKRDMAECPVNLNGGLFWTANVMIEKTL